jgi:hypothetical protein
MDSSERDYQQKLRAARGQQSNPFEFGVQEVFTEGAGTAVQASRSPQYGNVNIMPEKVLEGATSNFAQRDAAGNAPLDDPINQTGDVALQTSASRDARSAHQDPEAFETQALEERLAMYAKAGSNVDMGRNNRRNIGSLA